MNEQQLNDLLNQADQGSSTPELLGPDIAEQAIRLGNRRQTVRRTGLTMLGIEALFAALLITSILIDHAGPSSTHPSTPIASVIPAPEQASTDDEKSLAELRIQIAVQEALVDSLLIQKPEQPKPEITLVSDIQAQADLAAKRMVLAANRMENSAGLRDESQRLYIDVLNKFPQSVWAGIARKRIEQNETQNSPRSAVLCDPPIT